MFLEIVGISVCSVVLAPGIPGGLRARRPVLWEGGRV